MTCLLLIVALLISNVVSHYIPFIPTALTQIGFGILISLLFQGYSLEIETEWFLLLFIAPLLYNDGRHFPREELWRMKGPIFGNAIVLVLLTALGGGWFIHFMIPNVPLAAAFALAAILSPTDPVAVNGIAKRVHIPEKILNLVRGESLINDASGLVAFNYAAAAVVTGYFSVREAVVNFSYMFIVGALVGLVLGLFITWIRFLLRREGINDAAFHSLLQIMTPFIIFIISEDLLHASGVIAVVVAGIIHTLIRERTETLVAEEQVLTENLWSVVSFILNGIVFILLGLNIPGSIKATVESPDINNSIAVMYVLAIGCVILGIRFLWSYLLGHLQKESGSDEAWEKPTLITALLQTLTGVRGAVTMAGVLSIPYVVQSGDDFPERSLILFLAAGVILFTLLAATILLPLLSKDKSQQGDQLENIDLSEAKRNLLLTGIDAIRQEMNDKNEWAAFELIGEYRRLFHQLNQGTLGASSIAFMDKFIEVRRVGLKAERNYIRKAMDRHELDESSYDVLERALDYREEAMSQTAQAGILYFMGRMARSFHRFKRKQLKSEEGKNFRIRLADAQIKSSQAAIETLREFAGAYSRPDIVQTVISDYERIARRLERPVFNDGGEQEEHKERLRIKAMDRERAKIRELFEADEISRDQVKELRMFVNNIERVILQGPAE
ncbi:Na+/H+ antiporter [Peribacillus kribbensis]|uniref:Na+/H+ antiporter n=1 Tax=Peribacillus kribbensis TaxID=356658 RepID=UPI0003FF7D0F|nr:Na+/H+ antiporter [Peribacillus kribbensis]